MDSNKTQIPQDSIVSMCKKLFSLSGGRYVQSESYDVVAPRAGFFYGRYVLKTSVDGAVLDAILADAAANDGPGLVGYTRELVGDGWDGALQSKGFRLLAGQVGMMLALDGYAPQPPDAHVVRIGGDRLKEWSRVCEVSFPKPSEIDALRWWIDDESCEFYAYMEDGRIVGTLLGYAEDGNYGIHEVSTLPAYRRRGVCTALVRRALTSASAAGDRWVSLQASPEGAAVYERCGLSIVSELSTWFLPQK